MSTTGQPLTTWPCDTCGERIETVADGYVEWLTDDHGARSFRVVHHASASPRRRSNPEGCYWFGHMSGRNDLALRDFLGVTGVARLLAILEEGVADMAGFRDLFRRVQVPWYEEARPYLDELRAAGALDEYGDYAYFPDVLYRIAARGLV